MNSPLLGNIGTTFFKHHIDLCDCRFGIEPNRVSRECCNENCSQQAIQNSIRFLSSQIKSGSFVYSDPQSRINLHYNKQLANLIKQKGLKDGGEGLKAQELKEATLIAIVSEIDDFLSKKDSQLAELPAKLAPAIELAAQVCARVLNDIESANSRFDKESTDRMLASFRKLHPIIYLSGSNDLTVAEAQKYKPYRLFSEPVDKNIVFDAVRESLITICDLYLQSSYANKKIFSINIESQLPQLVTHAMSLSAVVN